MKTLTLNYYTDPGHGWIKCKLSLLISLGIADKISHYSYQRKDYVYLEEDCDAGLLHKTLSNRNIKLCTRCFSTNKQSKIRSYDSYDSYKSAEPSVPFGYTAEELEQDNPYNQWLYN